MTDKSQTMKACGVVLVAAFAMSTGPGQFAFGSLGLFILPLSEEYGWSRAEISLAATWFTITLAITIPFIGQLVDRFGTRTVLLPSVLICGVLLAAIGLLLTELWQLYLVFSLIGCLGAGANALPYLRTLSTWFDKRRGLAIGLAMGGSGFGYAYVPPMLQYLNTELGWRSGYYALAGITVFIALPLVYLFLFDANTEKADTKQNPERNSANDFSLLNILSNKLLWQLFIIFALLSFSLYGLLVHLVSMLTDRGMTGTDAAAVAATLGIAIVATRIVIGYFIDRFFAPYVAIVCFVLTALGLILLANGATHMIAAIAAICIGFSFGAEIDLLAYLTSRYYGVDNFGKVYGILFVSFLLGTSLGPYVYGYAYGLTGSYDLILLTCVCLIGLAGLLTLFLPRYELTDAN